MSNKTKSPTSSSDNLQVAKLEHEVQDEAGHHVIGNPGLPVITQNILFYLDHGSQMAFRQVCQSWKEQVDQPLFWIKKLNLKSHAKELGNAWIELVGRIQKGSDLEKEIIECLMKWYGKPQSLSKVLKGATPTHIAARFGYTNIVLFVASYSESINAPNSYGWTPLHIAAWFGSTEIFKFLAPQVQNPNAPGPDGWTPLQYASQQNHSEIVETLLEILTKKFKSNSEAIMNTFR